MRSLVLACTTLQRGGLYGLNGTQWEEKTATLPIGPSILSPTDFAFHPTRAGVIYLCAASVQNTKGGGGLYITTDGGTTWSGNVLPRSQLPPYHTSLQAFAPFVDPQDPDNTVYATITSHGTWVTHDGAKPAAQQTW